MTVEITGKIVSQMRAQGNQPGLIEIYRNEMLGWAARNPTSPDAKAIEAWLPKFPSRPFYTARELVPLFPALALALGYTARIQPQKASSRLARELEFCDLPKLKNTNGTSLFKHPVYCQKNNAPFEFFIVEHIHRWRKVQLSQAEFWKVCGA